MGRLQRGASDERSKQSALIAQLAAAREQRQNAESNATARVASRRVILDDSDEESSDSFHSIQSAPSEASSGSLRTAESFASADSDAAALSEVLQDSASSGSGHATPEIPSSDANTSLPAAAGGRRLKPKRPAAAPGTTGATGTASGGTLDDAELGLDSLLDKIGTLGVSDASAAPPAAPRPPARPTAPRAHPPPSRSLGEPQSASLPLQSSSGPATSMLSSNAGPAGQQGSTGDLVLGPGGEYRLSASVAGRLYPHQVEGVKWLWSLHAMRRGGILGDDMVRPGNCTAHRQLYAEICSGSSLDIDYYGASTATNQVLFRGMGPGQDDDAVCCAPCWLVFSLAGHFRNTNPLFCRRHS